MGLLGFFSNLAGDSGGEGDSDQAARRPKDELLEAVDHVIRLCRPTVVEGFGYRKRLKPAVQRTMDYADELISRLPGPLEINDESWAKDPLVNALFANIESFRDFFSRNKELGAFFKKSEAPRCHALLTMNYLEKKTLRAEQEGEILKRDVLKTALNFDDHRIVAPMESEAENREELVLRTLSILASHACEEIMSLKKWKHELEEEKHLLSAKMEILQAKTHGVGMLFSGQAEEAGKVDQAEDLLEQLDRKIDEIQSELGDPGDYFTKVIEVLNHPENYLQAKLVRVRITDMGIKAAEDDPRGREVHFSELSLSSGLKRAAVLVTCSRM